MFRAYFYENQEFMDWNEKNDIYRGVMDRKHLNFYQKKRMKFAIGWWKKIFGYFTFDMKKKNMTTDKPKT